MEQVKPQKSQFWVWTTLWLTAIVDSAGIFALSAIILFAITQFIKIPAILLFVLTLAARVLSLWLGACAAVKYVLKKTIVFKRDSQKLAFLTVIIPLFGGILGIVFSLSDFKNLIGNLLSALLVLGITYYSVRNLIVRYGSD